MPDILSDARRFVKSGGQLATKTGSARKPLEGERKARAEQIASWFREAYRQSKAPAGKAAWSISALARKSGVSRDTLHAIRDAHALTSARTLQAIAVAFDVPIAPELLRGDAVVTSGAQTGRATRRGVDPGTATATGRHRVAQDDQQGTVRMIADAIAKAIQQAVQMNELNGGKEASAGLVRALEGFAEALEQQGADVSGIYRLALKIQRGEL